ncbi:MAG: hypothetical protein KAX13_07015, partial [Candidatus Krumholzibacteria bacterium]|nr:hypothetical protein [Candidatus Krumholzibacteria bacterium]
MNIGRILITTVLISLTASAVYAEIQSPEEYFGFPVGADRKLADYKEIREYLAELATESPWMNIETIGTTTLGRPFVMAVISTPENLTDLGRYKEISRRLADPRGLTEQEAIQLAGEGKTFVMITCNLHSTEIGSAQMSAQLAYDIVAGRNEGLRAALKETILFLIPSLNPDGLQMVVDWYEKWVGTEYEGCRMPWLYHHYAGHDNNRDWFMVNLDETRAVFELYFESVIPQVVLDMHQMWSTGARLFLPQFYPPANVNVDPILYREIGLLGYFMQLECEEKAYKGVISDAYFTGYWEGTSMMTPWWHNQVGLLSEAASDFAIEALELPVTNALENEDPNDFYCPGSILEVSFKQGHPITYGMPDEGYIFFTRNPAFKTTVPFGKFDRTVLASYTDKQPLASGLLIGPEKLYRRAALLEMGYDRGKAVLFGFRPQHRCQTAGTYKLIFNAL